MSLNFMTPPMPLKVSLAVGTSRILQWLDLPLLGSLAKLVVVVVHRCRRSRRGVGAYLISLVVRHLLLLGLASCGTNGAAPADAHALEQGNR